MDKSVSIIIPFYNRENYLKQCLDSVINQSLLNIEVICVNDGSTDKSTNIVRDYMTKYDNIVLYEQENRGPGVARNTGIRVATAEYVAFLDSDDYYDNRQILEKLYINAKKRNVSICGGNFIYEKQGKRVYPSNSKLHFTKNRLVDYREYQCAYGFTRFIYHKNFLKDNDIFFPEIKIHEDPPFLAKAMIKARYFFAMNEEMYVCRKIDKLAIADTYEKCNSIAIGINLLLNVSSENKLPVLHKETIEFLDTSWNLAFMYKSIMEGNKELQQLLGDIDNNIDRKLLNKINFHVQDNLFLKNSQLFEIKKEIEANRKELICLLRGFENVVIYGAGMVGKMLHEAIKNTGIPLKVSFAVSDVMPIGTACGKEIVCIEHIKSKNSTLVLLAIRNIEMKSEMRKKAITMGFENIEEVNIDNLPYLI